MNCANAVAVEVEMGQRLLGHRAHQYILPEFSVQLLINETTMSSLNASRTSGGVRLLLTISPCVSTQRPLARF